MAKHLVTGAAGFIGSAVARMLVAQGHQVVGLDDLCDAYDPTLKHWRIKALQELAGFQFVHGDVTRPQDVEPILREQAFDAIVNLAAAAGVRQSIADPRRYIDVNISGTVTLLELARAYDVKKFLLASTSSLYGARNARPFREDANTDLPLSPYAASKKAAEAMVASWAHLYGMDALVPRYFTVYGPAGRPDMSVFRFVRGIAEGTPIAVHGDGTQERDFTYVDDIARGTIAMLALHGHHTINLGSDAPVTLNHMIGLVEKHVGRRANVVHRPAHKADVHSTWADIGAARTKLGWTPKVDLDEGIGRTAAWYRENRAWASQLSLGDA